MATETVTKVFIPQRVCESLFQTEGDYETITVNTKAAMAGRAALLLVNPVTPGNLFQATKQEKQLTV